ncbi:DUF5990 family protein [Paucibacter sp. R3-3]|uniref:DUF5990 family protein n=1 Tax=Roseateles agri TaxID=3098619 RepID=A0ABU5DHW9_9BURK|nr:DUF5990 family protein [Paucibacter sp. R3-3]MDY0745749.1 DUF5990 family protein [Paucibacter sp. R3-3]
MVQVKAGASGAPLLLRPFVHGPQAGRFLYLGWRDLRGTFTQRLKLPLSGVTWDQIRDAVSAGRPLVGTLVDRQPRVTSTGQNIGGTRPLLWKPL